MKRTVYSLACILLLQISHYAFGIEPDETGLKTGGDLRVPVVVLGFQEAEANVGLDEATVLREVELRLLRHGIIPANREAALALGWCKQHNTSDYSVMCNSFELGKMQLMIIRSGSNLSGCVESGKVFKWDNCLS